MGQKSHHEKRWKALAFESEVISKDILSKGFLPEELWHVYKVQVKELRGRMEKLLNEGSSTSRKLLEEKFSQIEGRLKFLHPENRIQTNFEFFTRKIQFFKSRIEFLRESLEVFDHHKKSQIEEEIAHIEQNLVAATRQREALLRACS